MPHPENFFCALHLARITSLEMNKLVIALPDSQVWRLLRVIPSDQSFIPLPARNPACLCDTRQTEAQALGDRLEDWLL
jgi:hypothetical protein